MTILVEPLRLSVCDCFRFVAMAGRTAVGGVSSFVRYLNAVPATQRSRRYVREKRGETRASGEARRDGGPRVEAACGRDSG